MRELNQREIVTVALYHLGGATEAVDTEDIAVKAAELAPGKFSWRKYRDNIDQELVRVALKNARIEYKYVSGSVKEGWMLAPAGLKFARGSESQQWATPTERPPERDEAKRTKQRTMESERMKRTDAYTIIQKRGMGEIDKLSQAQIQDFLRVDAYIKGQARERKLATLQLMFADDPAFGPIIEAIIKKIPKDK
jgi:hypothetical protein